MTVYYSQVIGIEPSINEKMLGSICFEYDNIMYFISENIFKDNLYKLLEKRERAKELTSFKCSMEKFAEYIQKKKLTLTEYEIIDNSQPDSIIPMVF